LRIIAGGFRGRLRVRSDVGVDATSHYHHLPAAADPLAMGGSDLVRQIAHHHHEPAELRIDSLIAADRQRQVLSPNNCPPAAGNFSALGRAPENVSVSEPSFGPSPGPLPSAIVSPVATPDLVIETREVPVYYVGSLLDLYA